MSYSRPALIDAQNFGTDEMYFVDKLRLPFNFPLHRHSFLEIEYMQSGGAGTNIVNGIFYPFKPGCMSIILPWQVHELKIDESDPPRLFKCCIRPDFAGDTGGILQDVNRILIQNPSCPPVVQFSEKDSARVEQLFLLMLEERFTNSAFSAELMSARVSELVVLYLRAALPENGTSLNFSVWNVVRQINTRSRESKLRCADIAASFGYSESRLSTLLRENTGMSFGEILREARVRTAIMYLTASDEKLENIASWSGFGSRGALYSAFVAVKGVSPSEYRIAHRSEGNPLLDHSESYTKLLYYVHSHYAEPLSLESLSKEFSYSTAYISRLFSANGNSFSELLAEVRVYNACKLLLISDLSVIAVGLQVGFSSPETFFRSFKRLRGETPHQYRAKRKSDGKSENAAH